MSGVESSDQCLLNSKVLSCFSGVIMSIRSFFLFSYCFEMIVLTDLERCPLVLGQLLENCYFITNFFLSIKLKNCFNLFVKCLNYLLLAF